MNLGHETFDLIILAKAHIPGELKLYSVLSMRVMSFVLRNFDFEKKLTRSFIRFPMKGLFKRNVYIFENLEIKLQFLIY